EQTHGMFSMCCFLSNCFRLMCRSLFCCSMAEKSADLTLTVGHTHTDHNLHHFADMNVER
ncbi:hypothetical protein GOODEAATRI_034386, partial [Goodea atripinnis]